MSQQRSRNYMSSSNTAPIGAANSSKKNTHHRDVQVKEAYSNQASVAQELAVKILMKKR